MSLSGGAAWLQAALCLLDLFSKGIHNVSNVTREKAGMPRPERRALSEERVPTLKGGKDGQNGFFTEGAGRPMGNPEGLAGVALFFALAASNFIHGVTLPYTVLRQMSQKREFYSERYDEKSRGSLGSEKRRG
jgi:hypothetical protein